MESKEKNTKEKILEEALKLFAQSGYMGTSMNDIASKLGVTKAALYKHYKSKQEILDSIIEKMKELDTLASTNELDFYLEPYRQEEQRRIDEITNSENSAEWLNVERDNMPLSNGMMTIGHCVDCAEIGVTVCAGEAKLVNEGYHRGFLGILQTDCYAYYFESRGALMCPRCQSVIEMYGYHACWEIHKKCSYGDYDVCPMQVS